jgi:DNA-binding SARP family transcriptional activator
MVEVANNDDFLKQSYPWSGHIYEHDGDILKRIWNAAEEGARTVFLCAEPYSGKSKILSRFVLSCGSKSVPARFVDFAQMDYKSSVSSLKDLVRWADKQDDQTMLERPKTVLACNNIAVGDEADTERMTKYIRRLACSNTLVLMSILPEGEPLVERMSEAICFWSSDLISTKAYRKGDRSLLAAYAKGIPCLCEVVQRADDAGIDSPAHDSAYISNYIKVFQSTVREIMISDEKRLRCSMLLFGYGDIREIEGVLGSVDDSLWRCIARDAPFFDVNIIEGTFDCVGAKSNDCLHAAFNILKDMVSPWPLLVYRVAQGLAKRGDYARAAIVSKMCTDDERRCSICLEWCTHMIDAGQVAAVSDAVKTTELMHITSLPGYNEARVVLDAINGEVLQDEIDKWEASHGRFLCGKHAELILCCRGLLQAHTQRGVCPAQAESGDTLYEALLELRRDVSLILEGKVDEAYERLLACPARLMEGSVTSGLLSTVYVFCSLLMGIVPSPLDVESSRNARQLFESSGLTQLCSLYDSLLIAGKILSGRSIDGDVLEAPIQRASRARDVVLQGLLLLAAGVSDMRIGAYTRSHVRLAKSISLLEGLYTSPLAKASHLLDLAVRSELGERIRKGELDECFGISHSTDSIVTLAAIAVLTEGKVSDEDLSWCEPSSYPREAHWLLNVLTSDTVSVSHRMRSVVPSSWVDSVRYSAIEVNEFFLRHNPTEAVGTLRNGPALANTAQAREGNNVKQHVEVHMLGGFDVYVNGSLLPNNRLERRRAKALLALLAAIPGHSAKRFVIMESIWPAYDYQSANKCVYSATSVLRSEVKPFLAENARVALLCSSKADATVSLNADIFTCDIDVFEKKARRVLGLEGSDREVVALGRELEDLYKGDLFVPPTDGMGVMQARARELKDLYADSMIVAANAASNLGLKTQACRFAKRAYTADDLREDAVRILITTLCAAGRKVEAERYYEKYVGHVVDITRRPPSRHLREEIQSVLGSFMDTDASRQNASHRGARDVRVEGSQDGDSEEKTDTGFVDEA